MQSRMKLGDFLIAYLEKIGVSHLFGIPGDLVINLFFKFGRRRGLKIVTLSHEPGVGFAADGYARATGRIGVICVTYGAGGHNMVNPVAGSFAERVPILVISGGPGEEERKLGVLIHHQAKEIESQYRIYREVTCAAKIIDDPLRAATDIDEVIRSIGCTTSRAIWKYTATWWSATSGCPNKFSIGTASYLSLNRTGANSTRRCAIPWNG